MIIDCHTHLGGGAWEPVWWKPTITAEQLVKHMDGPFFIDEKPQKVDISLVQPSAGQTLYSYEVSPKLEDWTFRKQHQNVIDAVKKYPDRLLGCMMINPRFGVEAAIEELDNLVREENFKAIKLHPTMHRYFPNTKEFTHPIMEKAAKLNVPVLIHTGDPIFGEPSRMEPLIEAFPEVKIILCHMGAQWMTYDSDITGVAKRNENVFVETGWGVTPMMLRAIAVLGPDKFVFGSDCPPSDMGTWLRVIEVLCWDPPWGAKLSVEDRAKILGSNMAKLLGIK
jgi:predicted TIM-barrel fold metal-dependent hydrolase